MYPADECRSHGERAGTRTNGSDSSAEVGGYIYIYGRIQSVTQKVWANSISDTKDRLAIVPRTVVVVHGPALAQAIARTPQRALTPPQQLPPIIAERGVSE